MAGGDHRLLASYLDLMGREELKEFRLRLPLGGSPPRHTPVLGQRARSMEVASQLVAQYGEQQAWALALHTWEQMGLSGIYDQAQTEVAWMSGKSPPFPSSPSAPSLESPSGPTSTKVLKFVQDAKTISRQPLRPLSTHVDPSFSFYQVLHGPPDEESPPQESPSAPTSTAVLEDWEPLPQPSPKPRKPEGARTGLPLAETSQQHSTASGVASDSEEVFDDSLQHEEKSPGSGTQSDQGKGERYQDQKSQRPCPTKSWANEDLHQEFIELLLLHHQESLIESSWCHRTVEKQGHLIEVKDLFGPGLGAQVEPRTVILHGVAGVGKSTMARQVRRAWEEGWLYRDRFQHVFYFNCRELAQSKRMSLKELITKDWAASELPTEQILSQSAQLLFILDDLDELKWVLREQKSEVCLHWNRHQPVKTLLDGLLERTILPKASLLITARTMASQQFILSVRQPQWVKVLGFSESGRKEYFYKYFRSESEAAIAFRAVESNQALLAMCLVPLVSWLVCTCLKKQRERGEALRLASQTSTALCLHYLSQALPAQPLGTQLRGLCSLVAKSIMQGKSLLIWEDLRKHKLEEATVSALINTGIFQKHPSSPSYYFPHRYLQEFFAAVSCVLGNEDEKSQLLYDIRKDLLEVYGVLDPFRAPITHFILGLLNNQEEQEMEAVFQCKVPATRRWELLQWTKQAAWQQHHILEQSSLPMLHCLYEIQDKDFLTHTMPHFHRASMCVHAGLELLVFMYCIKFCNVKKLQVKECGSHGHTWTSGVEALLSVVPVTNACWTLLSFLLGATENLKELDLSGNCLSHSAVQSLCKALKFRYCHLEALRLARCDLRAQSCRDLAWVLGASQTLTKLDLSFNPLLDRGAELLCKGLIEPDCRLQQLRLAGCGLTPTCCWALVSMLWASPGLTELDLQQNELKDEGVRLLCQGLAHPTCRLKLLWLDQTELSEEVTQMLRALEKERLQLSICSSVDKRDLSEDIMDTPASSKISGRMKASVSRKLIETMTNEGPSKEETSSMSSLKQKRQESGGSSSQVDQGELSLPSPASSYNLHMESLGTEDDIWGPLGPGAIEVVDEDRSLYRVHLSVAGSYRWPSTGLRFMVRGPVTIDIEFCAWGKLLHGMAPSQSWMVAGPLFDIKAEPKAVATVYLPHFMDLRGGHVDTSLFQVAHFKEEGMLMEKPTRVELYHVVLEEPSFSTLGVILRTIHTALRFLPVTSSVLLYHHLRPDETVFHLYLIPSDCCIRKAIDDEEKAFQFVQIRKPPPLASFYLGSRYTVSGSETLKAIPKELELCYRSPGEPQLFSEFYVGHLGSGLKLQLQDQNGTVMWEALVRPGDLRPAASQVPAAPAGLPSPPNSLASLHFVDRHREQLVARVTSVDPVLDRLLGQVLTQEQYERVRAKATTANQMRELFSFSRSWDRACKDQVYQALKKTHPYLIVDLWEMQGDGREQSASPLAQ